MKRIFSAGLAVLFVSSGLTGAVSAQEAENQEQEQASEQPEESTSGENQQTDSEQSQEDLVQTLTMEQAVDAALNDNSSLILMNYRLDNIRSQIEGSEDDYSDLQDDLDDLDDQMDELRDMAGSFQQRLKIQNQQETIEDNLDSLEDSIRQLNSNEIQIRYNREQAHRSAELSAKSTFVQLLMQQNQIEMTQASLENQKQQTSNVERRVEIGTAPESEYETSQREVRRLQNNLADARSQYNHDLAMFALDIGITYHEDLTLKAPELGKLEPIQQTTETEKLIEESFSMKNAQEALDLAEYNREQTQNDEDATSAEKEQADISVQTEQENIAQLRQNLRTSINSTFQQAQTQYQAVLQARDEVSYAEADVEDLRVQAEIGVIPQSEYDLAGIQVDQAEQELTSARWNLFLINEQIKAMQDGLVQQSGGASQPAAGTGGSAGSASGGGSSAGGSGQQASAQ
ncbi:TolC family protein [Salibacterium halotolerans]|uniref:Outer membrane efflux protein n=1 Tax=Salibacterium halotolerans TaxID=1884432 RepID=A0A1I5KZ68_9BACI|nr:TolC family protein [Salibacterium halotolerans]SFO90193.1 Outer membrane efflux protein [Salibacterium halotolerans]